MVAEGRTLFNIGEDCTLKARIGWQGLTVDEYKDNGNYLLVTGTDFNNGLVNWETCHYVDKWRYTQDKNIQLKNEDIVITKDGTIGKVGYVENLTLPATLNSGVFVVRPKDKEIFSKYLYYIFTSEIFNDFLNRLTAGSTINHLYQKDFVSFEFAMPNLLEQKAIAQALSDIDDLIASLEKLIVKKEHIKTATMQELLTGKKRLDGFDGEWEEKRLGDLARITRGASPRPIDSPIWFDNTSKVGWVRISDVTKSDKYLFHTVQKLSHKGIKSSRYVEKNNLIMSICATLGRPILTTTNVCIHDGFVYFKKLIINHEYLYYFLSFIQNDWSKNGQTGSQANLNTDLINNTRIYLSSDSIEQKAIATILSDMDTEIETLKTKLKKTKTIKIGMMQELLTGKTRLK